MVSKDFLNSDILGNAAGIANRRGFREVGTADVRKAEPDRHFFEAIPTAWAEPYFFSKSVEAGEPKATKEWVMLFLLHYFGVIYLTLFEREVLLREYDRDLWAGLENTYPFVQPPLQRLELLQTDDGAVLGATFPRVIFFPGRNRQTWTASAALRPYLEERRLSWERAFHLHLAEPAARRKFHQFLRDLAAGLLEGSFRRTLESFCDDNFGTDYEAGQRLGSEPRTWPTAVPEMIDQESLLRAYPLQNTNAEGGTDYYLIDDWPAESETDWLKGKTEVGIARNKYARGEGNELVARFADRLYRGVLGDNDHVISLSSLLTPTTYYCQPPADSQFGAYVGGLHEVHPRSVQPAEGRKVFSLAPLKAKFLEHFPETMGRLRHWRRQPLAHDRVEWYIPVKDKDGDWVELRWVAQMKPAPDMPFTTLMLYPPKVSPEWKFYALYGVGDKATQGRWQLVDEQGRRGEPLELDFDGTTGEMGDQYVSVLRGADARPNRPKALAYRDGNNEECGLLFCKDDWGSATVGRDSDASLAMDLGTSNSCLALKGPGGTEVMTFTLTPLRLWGPPLQGELPGFAPLEWSGKKGFFTSILLSRKNDPGLPHLTPQTIGIEHWFKVDIPSLHQKIEDQVFRENKLDLEWNYHTDLKWSGNRNSPFRSLFMELALLYAHAEALFARGLKISRYVFTYPLAFSDDYGQGYEEAVRHSLRRVRKHCYGEEAAAGRDHFDLLLVNESTAIAKSERISGAAGTLELFVDIGGGTADIAVRHGEEFLVLDSVRVAGRDFFRIAKRNFTEGHLANAREFKQCLSDVLEDGKQDVPLSGLTPQLEGNIGIYYAARMAGVETAAFREKEKGVLLRIEKQGGAPFFQKYRSMLFFEHIIGYALVQACAAAVSHKLRLTNGLRLILAGNCWGLLMFAGYERSRQFLTGEAKALLGLIKQQSRPRLREGEAAYLDFDVSDVALLSEKDLSKAKTSVARGAIEAVTEDANVADKAPYTGVNIPRLQIGRAYNKVDWAWCDRWSKAALEQVFGRIIQIQTIEDSISADLGEPFDPLMAVFTAIGKLEPPLEDTLPSNVWRDINSEVIERSIRNVQVSGQRLTVAPLNYFLSEVLYPDDAPRDFLDELAKANGHF